MIRRLQEIETHLEPRRELVSRSDSVLEGGESSRHRPDVVPRQKEQFPLVRPSDRGHGAGNEHIARFDQQLPPRHNSLDCFNRIVGRADRRTPLGQSADRLYTGVDLWPPRRPPSFAVLDLLLRHDQRPVLTGRRRLSLPAVGVTVDIAASMLDFAVSLAREVVGTVG